MSAVDFPAGWIELALNEINTFVSETVDPSSYPGETFELYSVPSFPSGNPEIIVGKDIGSTKQTLLPDDVLVCKINPRINRVWQVKQQNHHRQIGSSEWIGVRVHGHDPRFFRYYFSSPRFRELICTDLTGVGGSLTRAQPKRVATFPVPVPPLNEQKRIADKLDAVLARVDACRERLARLPGILKRFRQAVLATATSGVLTTDWRGERVKHLSKLLPDTWEICKIRDVGSIQLGRQRSPKYHRGDNMRPYLRVQNVFEDRLDLSDIMEMDFSEADFEKYQLHYGDILLNEGQSPEYLGRPAMFRGELENVCFTNTLIRFQASDRVIPDYALLVFRNHMHSGRYVTEGNITTNIAHLGAGRFGNVEFPLPPIEEQHEIVRRVGALFVHADALEAKYHAARDQVGHLTPSLLARAFRGELVSQDPNDEPAEKLLERIRAARAVQPSVIRTRRARTPRQAAISTSAQSVAAMPAPADMPTTQTSTAPQVSSFDLTSTLATPAGSRTLADLRKAAGLNQAVVAKAMGLNQAYISQMETGKRAITEDLRCKLAEILGASVEEIPKQ